MTRYLVAYATGAVTFLVVDMIWLGVVAKDLYRREIGGLLLDQPLYGPAAAFYAVYVIGSSSSPWRRRWRPEAG